MMFLAAAFMSIPSTNPLQQSFPVVSGYESMVMDARSRFARNLNGRSELVESSLMILLDFNQEICVHFRYTDGSIGRPPTYCYDVKTKKFTRQLGGVD